MRRLNRWFYYYKVPNATIFKTTKNSAGEFGIRKVLGAPVAGIVGLLSKDFAKLVLLAKTIAWPVAFYALNRWLEDLLTASISGDGSLRLWADFPCAIRSKIGEIHVQKLPQNRIPKYTSG